MGCCCDQDDDVEILRHLNPSPPVHSPPLQPPPADHSTAILSPMNSHFFALSCRDILRLIFEHLSIPDLARSSCVCRLWHSVASDQEIVAGAFKAPWKVKDVVGKPSSWSFWRDNCLGKFAISHRILRGDSLASLAVKYSVQVRASNIIVVLLLRKWLEIRERNSRISETQFNFKKLGSSVFLVFSENSTMRQIYGSSNFISFLTEFLFYVGCGNIWIESKGTRVQRTLWTFITPVVAIWFIAAV